MPKGALLHAHLDATVNASYLLQLALGHSCMHIRINEHISASKNFSNQPEFKPLPENQFSKVKSLADPSYELQTWISLKNARDNFPDELGGKDGFDKWVIGSMAINPSEAYGTHNTIEKVKSHSFPYFGNIDLSAK
jgi:adenosine deaminase CECR1